MPLWTPGAAGPSGGGVRRRLRHPRLLAPALAGLALVLVVLAAAPRPAGAHPLGNFTVNRYAKVEISAGVVRVYYVLDEAEIPAFQERRAVAKDRETFTVRRVAEIASNLELVVDDQVLALHARAHSIDQPKGQGGLTTLRIAAIYEARLPAGPSDQRHRLEFSDRNEPDRVGWREIIALARGDARIVTSNAPNKDLSDELRKYPGNLIQAPLDLRSVRLSFTPGSQPVDALAVPRSAAPPTRAGGGLAALITRDHINAGVLAGMLGVAFLFGALHAVGPGHGKTVMGAYLVGTKGRPVDAVLLGVIVSLMHTASVLLLGLVLFKVKRSVPIERVYPALEIGSGLVVVAIGLWLLLPRLRRLRATSSRTHALAHSHAHSDGHEHHDGHVEDHDVHHHHGPGGHTHELPDDVAPLSRRGLIVLATSGGIFPSPTAVILVVSAFSIGRIALGLTLIVAFSIGLASTLTIVGLSLVYGRSLFERRWPNRSLRVLPVIGAAALILAGLVLAARGTLSL